MYATGSGFLVDREDRLVVTAYHVVENKSEVWVLFPDFKADGTVYADREHYYNAGDKYIRAKVVRKLKRKDLALLQLDKIPTGFVPVKLATDRVQPGESVYTVGNPGASGGMWIFSDGSVRQIFDQQEIHLEGGQVVVADTVETQNPTNPGDSGGPVLNTKGDLVGVTSSGAPDGDLVSHCIDATEVKRMLSQYRRSQ